MESVMCDSSFSKGHRKFGIYMFSCLLLKKPKYTSLILLSATIQNKNGNLSVINIKIREVITMLFNLNNNDPKILNGSYYR
uniref:Uncharacterized protein n=1 Tax=Schistosoma haematobium TaxID=6185 RepID=A0A094ZCD6_SCHHA